MARGETGTRDPAELARFAEDLDRWGGEIASWPPRARDRGRKLLARSRDARALLSQQQSLDRALTALRDHRAPAHLADAIVGRVRKAPGAAQRAGVGASWEQLWAWLTGALWRPALAACAPLLLGFVLGAALPTAADRQAADQLSALASTDLYQELSDADQ